MDEIRAWIDGHFADIIARSREAVIARYAASEQTYVFLEGPRWSNRGHANIATGWQGFFNSSIAMEQIEWIEGPYMQASVSGDMAWIGGIIDISLNVGGQISTTRFRATFVLSQIDGRWGVIHEHVSQPLDDPYGVGDWLPKAGD